MATAATDDVSRVLVVLRAEPGAEVTGIASPGDLAPPLAAGSCEWCAGPFASQPGKRHCSQRCRSLNEDYRHRMHRLRDQCESGELPRYGTRGKACQVAALLRRETGGRYRAFDAPCPFCAGWHVVRKGRRRGRPATGGVRRGLVRELSGGSAVTGTASPGLLCAVSDPDQVVRRDARTWP